MDFEKAEACYRKALALDPNHIAALCSLAWMLRNHKNGLSPSSSSLLLSSLEFSDTKICEP